MRPSFNSAVSGVNVPPECVDQPELANCELIVYARLCSNSYYSSFCCASCTRHSQRNDRFGRLGWSHRGVLKLWEGGSVWNIKAGFFRRSAFCKSSNTELLQSPKWLKILICEQVVQYHHFKNAMKNKKGTDFCRCRCCEPGVCRL